jgi:hypothetical protein
MANDKDQQAIRVAAYGDPRSSARPSTKALENRIAEVEAGLAAVVSDLARLDAAMHRSGRLEQRAHHVDDDRDHDDDEQNVDQSADDRSDQ